VLDHFATVTNRVASANHFTPPGRSLEGTCGVLSGLHLLPNPEMGRAGRDSRSAALRTVVAPDCITAMLWGSGISQTSSGTWSKPVARSPA
jgi:hypothetical protein